MLILLFTLIAIAILMIVVVLIHTLAIEEQVKLNDKLELILEKFKDIEGVKNAKETDQL